MGIFSAMVRDMLIIGIIASFCDFLLPRSDIKRPVQLVFGLYFMALLMNPLVSIWTGIDLSTVDFSEMGDASVAEVEMQYDESMVYREAASTLETDIKGKLESIYQGFEVTVNIMMEESGFRSVDIVIKDSQNNDMVMVAEIKEYLASEYGIPGNVVNIKS